ncbi:MAG: cupin domain-containing protein [Candidatus Methanoperedens sp.]|nr:cupin domain-containing protein [Candidatus Methanoperedens sp.]
MEHINLQDLFEYSRATRVVKEILRTDWFNVVLVCLEAGQEIQPHPEPYAVVFHVIDGEGTITAGAERYDVKPNHMIFVPKDGVRGIAPRTRMSLVGIQQPH